MKSKLVKTFEFQKLDWEIFEREIQNHFADKIEKYYERIRKRNKIL